jgi:hypothetical protein
MRSILPNSTAQNILPNIGDSKNEEAQEYGGKNERDLCSSFHAW